MNIYLELTREFNAGRLRAVICSGQAVVLHRLAIMSKDGDWILREDKEAVDHILSILAKRGATYRFGAPLDLRWLRGGWSSHFEFQQESLRVRTDFFTRPPRLSPDVLQDLWTSQEGRDPAFVGLRELADMKKTNREKDYAVIGELARKFSAIEDQLLYSRSARDLLVLKSLHPAEWDKAVMERKILAAAAMGLESLESALDQERRKLMRENESRLDRYEQAADAWATRWPNLSMEISGLSLHQAHARLTAAAEGVLPHEP